MIAMLGGNSTFYLDVNIFYNEKEEIGTCVHFKESYKMKFW